MLALLICISHLTSPRDASLLIREARRAGISARVNPPGARTLGLLGDCDYIAAPGVLHAFDRVYVDRGIILFRAPLTSERAAKLVSTAKGAK